MAAAAAVLRRRRLHGALAQRASLLGTGRSGPVSKLTPTVQPSRLARHAVAAGAARRARAPSEPLVGRCAGENAAESARAAETGRAGGGRWGTGQAGLHPSPPAARPARVGRGPRGGGGGGGGGAARPAPPPPGSASPHPAAGHGDGLGWVRGRPHPSPPARRLADSRRSGAAAAAAEVAAAAEGGVARGHQLRLARHAMAAAARAPPSPAKSRPHHHCATTATALSLPPSLS